MRLHFEYLIAVEQERLRHRRATGGLNAGDVWHLVGDAQVVQLLEALPHSKWPDAAADRLDVPVRHLPIQVFGDLESERLHRLAPQRAPDAAVVGDSFLLREALRQHTRLVIVAFDSDHVVAVEEYLGELGAVDLRRPEDPETAARPGAIRGERRGHVARRAQRHLLDAGLDPLTDADRRGAVLEGAGR